MWNFGLSRPVSSRNRVHRQFQVDLIFDDLRKKTRNIIKNHAAILSKNLFTNSMISFEYVELPSRMVELNAAVLIEWKVCEGRWIYLS